MSILSDYCTRYFAGLSICPELGYTKIKQRITLPGVKNTYLTKQMALYLFHMF